MLFCGQEFLPPKVAKFTKANQATVWRVLPVFNQCGGRFWRAAKIFISFKKNNFVPSALFCGQ
jgi:hypothetical protein